MKCSVLHKNNSKHQILPEKLSGFAEETLLNNLEKLVLVAEKLVDNLGEMVLVSETLLNNLG